MKCNEENPTLSKRTRLESLLFGGAKPGGSAGTGGPKLPPYLGASESPKLPIGLGE